MSKIIKNGLEYGDTSLPSGGEKDQVLAKKSSLDNDVEWKDTGLSTEDWSDIMTPLPGQPTEGIIISPEERQVGWYYNMDGSGTKKPIYQKMVELTHATQIPRTIILSGVDVLVDVSSVLLKRLEKEYQSSGYFYSTSDFVTPYILLDPDTHEAIYVPCEAGSSGSKTTYYRAVIKYTKTTDTYA